MSDSNRGSLQACVQSFGVTSHEERAAPQKLDCNQSIYLQCLYLVKMPGDDAGSTVGSDAASTASNDQGKHDDHALFDGTSAVTTLSSRR